MSQGKQTMKSHHGQKNSFFQYNNCPLLLRSFRFRKEMFLIETGHPEAANIDSLNNVANWLNVQRADDETISIFLRD